YCIYGYMLMMRKRQIPKGIMLPKDEDPKKCKDVEAYIKMTSTQLLLVGILLVAYGVLELINTYEVAMPIPIFAVIVLAMVALVWFAVRTKKANNTYF